MLVLGFSAIGAVMVVGSMTAGAVVPLILLFAAACWIPTILMPWRRATRVRAADRKPSTRDRADPRSVDLG